MTVAIGILTPFLELKKYLNRALDSDYIKFDVYSGSILSATKVRRSLDEYQSVSLQPGLSGL